MKLPLLLLSLVLSVYSAPAASTPPDESSALEVLDVADPTLGFFSTTDAYVLQTLDQCFPPEEVRFSFDGTTYSINGQPLQEPLEGDGLKIRAAFLILQDEDGGTCCACGKKLGGWWPFPRCWVNDSPCCCTAAISPDGKLKCSCKSGPCPT